MEWSSSDESIATVSPRGIVTGIAPGEATLTVKVTSKEGIVFTANSKVVVTEKVFAPGDINIDGVVDVADAFDIINYILGKPSAPFMFDAADLNGDGKVDVSDIVRLIPLITKSGN